MKLYKLTDENHQTYNKTQWGENITNTALGNEKMLCSASWIHAYLSPELAIFLNPIHSNFENPVLWEAEGEVGLSDRDLKVGCKSLKTIKIIQVPIITTEQKVKIAIKCTLEVYKEKEFEIWANNWLDKLDRSVNAAYAVANARGYDANARGYDPAYAAHAANASGYDPAYAAAYAAYAAFYNTKKILNIQKIINEILNN